jgi:uncharacterized protein YkwD
MPTPFVRLAAALVALAVAPLAIAASQHPIYLPMVTGSNTAVPMPPQATALPQPTAVPTSPPADRCYDPNDPNTGINIAACEAEIIRLVNIERAKVGCPAAVRDERLMQGARNWADEMARTTFYGHSPNGWYLRPENGGFEPGLENIGPPASPEGAVNGWMGSPGHRQALLYCANSNLYDPSYNPNEIYEVGVGLNLNGGTVFVIN